MIMTCFWRAAAIFATVPFMIDVASVAPVQAQEIRKDNSGRRCACPAFHNPPRQRKIK